MAKRPQTYITSDWHLGHWNPESQRGIITFERWEFEDIESHDQYLIDTFHSWIEKMAPGSTLWFLGDFGETSYLWVFDQFRDAGIEVKFLLGNHDKQADIPEIKKHVDQVYEYPVFLSQKLVFSHFPVAVYGDSLNVCGHLHGAKLQDPNHLIASIAVCGYHPLSEKHINNAFSNLPTFNRRFLYEPWAEDYVFTQPKEDVIMDKDGKIDLSASRVLQRLNTERRKSENDKYQPYNGTLN